jgi:S-adenosylmethionine-diacylglycerol 3-amino-3-carboxypropyl transferase
VLPVLRERIRKLACDFPVSDNYFAWQAFARRYDDRPAASLPPYLQPARFAALASHAKRARVLNRSLTEALAAEPSGSKHAYVLLDAQDWMTDAQLGALWAEIDRTAAPRARVIFRTGGAADILPGRVSPTILGRWRYDAAASEAGTAADRSAIYGGFHVWRRAA